jgi:hypothetical protein
MVVSVPETKRKELIAALETLPGASPGSPSTTETYEAINDRTRIFWEARWETESAARRFLGSETFRAIRGAARVVGTLESIGFGRDESIV